MSLTNALNLAVGSLSVNQRILTQISNNVVNVNTPGYTRKEAQVQARYLNGQGAGVEIAQIRRIVDQNLLKNLRIQTSAVNNSTIRYDYYNRMQDMFGQPGSNTDFGSDITNLANAFEQLAIEPENSLYRTNVINTAIEAARQIRDMANETQDMRADADQEITRLINEINVQLQIVNDLNREIIAAQSSGQNTTEFEDQRDQAVEKISENLDITTFVRESGEMVVLTATGGRSLVNGGVYTLAHTPASSTGPTTSYPGFGIGPINLNSPGGVIDITGDIRSGKIKALVDMRDTVLPEFMGQLETLAVSLMDEVNALHNDGVAYPAPTTLTGTQTTADGNAVSGAGATGTVYIATVDANGDYVARVAIDLTTTATVLDVRNAINAALGAGTATINASGNLVLDGGANGIAINEGDSDIGGRGFSHYFGMNDFFTGTNNTGVPGDLALTIDVGDRLKNNPILISRGELQNLGAAIPVLPATLTAVTVGDNTVAQRLANKFTESLSYGAGFSLSAIDTNFSGYAQLILSKNSNDTANTFTKLASEDATKIAIEGRIGEVSGVNMDEELTMMTIVESSYQASARIVQVVQDMLDVIDSLLA